LRQVCFSRKHLFGSPCSRRIRHIYVPIWLSLKHIGHGLLSRGRDLPSASLSSLPPPEIEIILNVSHQTFCSVSKLSFNIICSRKKGCPSTMENPKIVITSVGNRVVVIVCFQNDMLKRSNISLCLLTIDSEKIILPCD
jgi:hypothetical protein